MKLTHIDRAECYDMKDNIKAIATIYQMEREFTPYLTIEFRPNYVGQTGIILEVENKKIYKNYNFDDDMEVDALRKLIWDNLDPSYIEDHDVTIYDSVIKVNLQKLSQTNRSNLSIMKDLDNEAKCLSMIARSIASNISAYFVQHEWYRLSGKNTMDINTCIDTFNKICSNNYLKDTATHDICTKEVDYRCNYTYNNNSKKEYTNKIIVEKVTNDLKDKFEFYNPETQTEQELRRMVTPQLIDRILRKSFVPSISTVLEIMDEKHIEGFGVIKDNTYIFILLFLFVFIIMNFWSKS